MREKLDLTDNEMYYLSLALDSYICSRDSYFTSKSCRITNNLIKKVVENAIKRKDSKRILQPLSRSEEDYETN